MRQIQERRLEQLDVPILWHDKLEDVPAGPSIIVANEFIDALPVRQAVKQADGWHERVIEIAPEGNFVIGTARDPLPFFETSMPRGLRQAPAGSIYEWRADDIALELGRRMRSEGAALIIDYGHAQYGLGDTLQAVAGHSFTDPLRAPGKADLTAHVDFEALAQCAESMGARIHGPIRQRDLFLRLGIEQARRRAEGERAARQGRRHRDRLFAADGGAARAAWANCSRRSPLPLPKLGPLPGFEEQP